VPGAPGANETPRPPLTVHSNPYHLDVHGDPISNPGPLAGLRVLDFSSVVMGPYATQILGDLGADVIAVEAPGGDTNRVMGPGPVDDLSGVALNLLRNKRNVVLDVQREAGRDALLRIAATSDVMVTNLRPGSLGRLRLTYSDICRARPDIVMCQAQGWPTDGPAGDRPAYDDVIQAASGIAHTFQLRSGTPDLAPTLVADKVAGLTIVSAVLAALVHRERTGEGQLVEVAMIEALTSFTLVEHGSSAIPVPPLERPGYRRIVAPQRRPFATSDGWIAVLPYSTANYRDLFVEGGRLDLLDDPRIATAASRAEHAPDLYELVETIVATRPTAYWTEFCERHDIPAGPVRTLDEIVEELPVAHHPTAGRYRVIPSPMRLSGTPTSVRRPAPRRGEHTEEVLTEVGLSADEIRSVMISR
jgi:crotonobetainyl-CoA:carnitine CoA-transferase CaiB-like acyl-CoA transferase